jgi:copper(I)-binding protein
MKFLILVLGVLFAAGPASAQAEGPIHVVDARARPTPPGATTAAIYLTIMNHGAVDDTLNAIKTPVADAAQMHRSATTNGVATMESVPSLTVKAGDGVTFSPGGLHIMLLGLKQALTLGQTFPLTLDFAKAGPEKVTVTVTQIKLPKGDMPGMKM